MAAIQKYFLHVGEVLCLGLLSASFASGQVSTPSNNPAKERTRVLISNELPQLDGNHLKLTLLEVSYGPGESSPRHSHPCAVVAYIVEGSVRSQIQGEPERTYRAGETFYEPPNGVHLVSANASSTKSARILAYLLCDHEGPLGTDLPQDHH